ARAPRGRTPTPAAIKNQMEGGAMQGMSRALHEEVKWNDFAVTTTDWRRFPVFKFGDGVPEIQSMVIDRRDKLQMGAGECTITIAAAAIANAIFDATGARIRRVPFTPANVLEAFNARS